jgi:phage terminase small subunit
MSQNPEQSAYLKLSPKRKEFVDAYFRCEMNATKAAIAAGYSERSAYSQADRMMKNADVKAAIEEKRQEIARENDVSIDWVVQKAKKVVIRSMQEEPVYDNEGNPTGIYKFDSAGANGALKILAKYLGMDKSTVKHEGVNGLGIVLNLAGKQKDTDNGS